MQMKVSDKNVSTAPTVEVLYMCEQKHMTPVKFHAQVKDFPKLWDCQTCHQKSKYVASASTPSDEYVPDPKKLSVEMREGSDGEEEEDEDIVFGNHGFTRSHLAALHERRSDEELHSLLADRLAAIKNTVRY